MCVRNNNSYRKVLAVQRPGSGMWHTTVPHCLMGGGELSGGGGCLIGVFNMMVFHYFNAALRGSVLLHSSDDVMFRRQTAPPSPLFFSCLPASCVHPPFFSGAQNTAFPLVNSTIEMLRISTNQGPGAPSHRYHSNPSQLNTASVHACMDAQARNTRGPVSMCVFSSVWRPHVGNM